MNTDYHNDTLVDKGVYPHFMLKEIMEQPQVLRKSLVKGIASLKKAQLGLDYSSLELEHYQRIVVLACGTAYHAGLIGKCFMEKAARLPVTVEWASEFRYTDPFIDSQTLVVVISQSGETGDTLAALRAAKAKGGQIIAITNVVGSTISREADRVIYTEAGTEISVASTKAYMAQLVTLYLLGLQLAQSNKKIAPTEVLGYLETLNKIPIQLDKVLAQAPSVITLAERLAESNHAFFLGRGIDVPVALEGSLKLKETSYLHAEAYAAGEFRHGPIALIEEGSPTIVLATQPELTRQNAAVVKELRARGAWVIGVTRADDEMVASLCDDNLSLPSTLPEFAPMLAAVPLQLLAYYTACARGNDVDKPRNLVKSVKDATLHEEACTA